MAAYQQVGTAPAQQQMLEHPAPDWDKVLVPATAPMVYNPPQLQKSWVPFCASVTWYMQTGGCCAKPLVPCCCAQATRYCCNPDAEDVNLLDLDATLTKMLSYPNPRCPERLRGVWWMSDNQVNQETLMTFEDADWVDGTRAVKNSYENWIRTPTCFGIVNATINFFKKGKMPIHVSPDGKWVLIEGYRIYLLGPDEKLTRPDGQEVERTRDDMMRIDMKEDGTVTYQYMVRKIASLDANGKLVKTENFKRFQEQAQKGQERIKSCWCNYFLCGDDFVTRIREVNPWGIIRWPKSAVQ